MIAYNWSLCDGRVKTISLGRRKKEGDGKEYLYNIMEKARRWRIYGNIFNEGRKGT